MQAVQGKYPFSTTWHIQKNTTYLQQGSNSKNPQWGPLSRSPLEFNTEKEANDEILKYIQK